ncbi:MULTISPECIES: hypothetical protein [Thalassospira]|uniref:hypothetical protein n=1 Tax=Thalassospira TaxID=168934 RepID=UPI0008DD9EB9|nr:MULTISPECIES: hypothetical protein [Thalassospira]MDM7975203.1 hypothetical protein [Thalassospira xiamenensis]OHZ01011.1 hypothetical protein BC440_09240 [Thalassospira sp. MIT1004]
MTAIKKPVLPLAHVPHVPVPANDALPRATKALPGISQQIGFGGRRRDLPVVVEAKRPQRINVMDCAEKAFFPWLVWSIYCSYDQDDADNRAVIDAMKRDLDLWADLMLPGQWSDFKREANNAVMAALEPMFDRNAGGWQSIKVLMVFLLLVKWVDTHADQPMFTTDIARVLADIAAHLDRLHGDECDAVEPSAHKMLGKVIARVKQCGLFQWLPDYRGIEA